MGAVGGTLALLLIGLLVIRELTRAFDRDRGDALARTLNFVIVPLYFAVAAVAVFRLFA